MGSLTSVFGTYIKTAKTDYGLLQTTVGLLCMMKHFRNISTNSGMTGNQVLRIFEDASHNLWVWKRMAMDLPCLTGFNVLHYTESSGVPANIYAIAQMTDGTFLAGGKNTGLIKFSQQNDNLITSKLPSSLLNQTTITTLVPNKNGSVWIGTSDAGAVLWDKKVILAIDDKKKPAFKPSECYSR